MQIMQKLIFTILFLFSMICSCAYGQNAPTNKPDSKNPPGTFLTGISGVSQTIKNKMADIGTTDGGIGGKLFDTGLNIAKKTTTWALSIAGTLALLYLIIEAFGILSSKNGALIQVIFDVGLPVILCSYLLLNYATLIQNFAGFGNQSFLSFIRGLGGDPISGVMDMFTAILTMIEKAVKNAWNNVSVFWGLNEFTNLLIALVDLAISITFVLLIIGLCFSGLAEVIGLVLMGPFLGAVAVAFGPIFIAGVVTPWTREYFSKWVGFLVASAVLTGVVGVCITIATTLFATFNFLSVAGTSAPTATSLMMAAIIVMSINSLIQQAPSIANAMVPGSFGASAGSGKAVGEGAKKVGNAAKGKVTYAAQGMANTLKSLNNKRKENDAARVRMKQFTNSQSS
jgi:hypothetical protein